jgi:anion-transporting  ArsA/GET3 family ATPase
MTGIDGALQQRRILITCGTGGVGKTTVSAALALRAALLGRKAVVVTIDPAKRLATSLGMEELGDHPTDLTPQIRAALESARASGVQGLPSQLTGSLDAIMPDTRRTFEAFVSMLAPNPGLADRVMRNPIFQIFAREFSGTNEYMALERLYALDKLGRYDTIILDTPPSRNTLAFLDAPKLLARFFDEKLIKWLVLPANKLVAGGMKKALGILEKLTGQGFMSHLFDFASALFEVQAKFTDNLGKITRLLESKDVGFLLVATPAPDNAPEVGHFIRSVREHNFRFDGVALNRTLSYLEITGSDRRAAQEYPAGKGALELVEALQQRERRAIEELMAEIGRELKSGGGGTELLHATLPELARDVHSVEDLLHVALALDRDTAADDRNRVVGSSDGTRPALGT